MTFLIVGGDSGIAKATLAALGDAGLPAIATTRRRETLGPDRVFLDLTMSLDDWQPPAGVTAVCIFAAVANLVDCARDPVEGRKLTSDKGVEQQGRCGPEELSSQQLVEAQQRKACRDCTAAKDSMGAVSIPEILGGVADRFALRDLKQRQSGQSSSNRVEHARI